MLNTGILSGHHPLGIALSGGSDSTALLMLACDAIGAQNLRAVTVDHGLRTEAINEANRAAALCAEWSIPHEILRITLEDGGDLQARARTARYAAISKWALENSIAAIALGHTQDDVAETFLMRLARGSGIDGLAQMPEQFERNGTTFLRPLLNASREDLQNALRKANTAWSEDPSNHDPRFTRVKMRQAQPQLDELGLTRERLSQTAHWMRAASEVLEQAAESWIAQHAKAEHGDAVFDLNALKNAPEETAGRVLTRALCNISQNPYRPRLSALLDLMQSDNARTLHGCLAYIHQDTLRITREENAERLENARWMIEGPRDATYSVKPLGAKALSTIQNWRETALLPRRSLLASPSIWQGGTLIAAPLAKPDLNWIATAPNPLHLAK